MSHPHIGDQWNITTAAEIYDLVEEFGLENKDKIREGVRNLLLKRIRARTGRKNPSELSLLVLEASTSKVMEIIETAEKNGGFQDA